MRPYRVTASTCPKRRSAAGLKAHALEHLESSGRPVSAPLLIGLLGPPRGVENGESPDGELPQSAVGSGTCENEGDSMRTLLESRANLLISVRAERVAAAHITQENRTGRQLDEAVDRLLDVWCRHEARAGAARPRNARRMDRDASRSHGPQFGLRHGIEVGREHAEASDASSTVVGPAGFLGTWRSVPHRRETYGAKDGRHEEASSLLVSPMGRRPGDTGSQPRMLRDEAGDGTAKL